MEIEAHRKAAPDAAAAAGSAVDWSDADAAAARAVRLAARSGELRRPTAGLAPRALQANLVVLPAAFADAFHAYCAANPKPCPLLDRSPAPGDRRLPRLAADLDVARDAPGYRLFRAGRRAERVDDLAPHWRADFVAFALGCSFSFEAAMEAAGVEVRHARSGRNVAMYQSAIETTPVGLFRGPMVVSMRPLRPADVDRVVALCARYPHAHGAPVHVGDPAGIGVEDLSRPDFGDPPDIRPGEVPAFWACGVTPQLALAAAAPDLAATHEPGCMLVADRDAQAAIDAPAP